MLFLPFSKLFQTYLRTSSNEAAKVKSFFNSTQIFLKKNSRSYEHLLISSKAPLILNYFRLSLVYTQVSFLLILSLKR